jgi:hypothetical protein
VTTQRIAGIGGIDDDAAALEDVYSLLDQSGLRIVGMDIEELRH